MKHVLPILALVAVPVLGHADDEVWRWQDGNGKVHYTNVRAHAPAHAEPVKTRIVVEADRLPGADLAIVGGDVVDGDVQAAPRETAAATVRDEAERRPHRIYDEERLRFGCFTGKALYFGGWSHSEDISPVLNCYPYRLGPEAWLNAARAELAMRQHGIDPKEMYGLYERYRADALPYD